MNITDGAKVTTELAPVSGTRRALRILGEATPYLLWFAIIFVDAGKDYFTMLLAGNEAADFWERVWATAPWWVAWMLLTPAALAVFRRFRIEPGSWRETVPVYLVGGLVLTSVHVALVATMAWLWSPVVLAPSWIYGQSISLAFQFLMVDLMIFWGMAAAYHAIHFYQRFKERSLETMKLEASRARLQAQAERLRALASEARLDALRRELSPHFLFNALNAVSGLVRRRENDDAVEMIARLGDLLRSTLAHEELEIPLYREIQFLETYLGIEQVRFGSRLTVEFEVDQEVEGAMVPPLILQPLVENAVRHGIARRPGPGRIQISAHRQGADLLLLVTDSGVGLGPGQHIEGVGLSNTKARLSELYGPTSRVTLENAEGSGALATIKLPFHREQEVIYAEFTTGIAGY